MVSLGGWQRPASHSVQDRGTGGSMGCQPVTEGQTVGTELL